MQQKEFFERYEIDVKGGRLGGGAFGTVYRAYDHLRDQWKAIKIAEVKFIDGKEFSLISEFQASQAIPLNKFIAHYECVEQFHMSNGLFDYAVMQYYPEGNLKQLLAAKVLQLNEKFAIINGILQGITFLHQHHIIHRDIKPSNILMAVDSRGSYIPKIADFGLSKSIHDADLSNISNSFGGGTLDYSSPEQLYGHPLRPNSDLWSFGVITYEVFTGKKPFSSDDVNGSPEAKRRAIYQKIVHALLPEDVNQCPEPYGDIIKLCLIKDPKQRVKKGEDLIEFLKNPVPLSIPEESYYEEETLILGKPADKEKEINPIEIFKKGVAAIVSKPEPIRLTTEEEIRKRAEESAKQRAFEDAKQKAEEARIAAEARLKQEAEELDRQRVLEEEKKRIESEKRAEEERARIEAEHLRLAEEKRRIQEEAKRIELEIQKQKEEEARKAEEQRIQRELEEQKRHRAIEEEKRRVEAERKVEEERVRAEAEKMRLAEEKRRQEAEAQHIELEIQKRKEEEARLAEEARLRRELEEQERQRAIELEKQRIEAEKRAEQERIREEADRLRLAEEKRKQKAEAQRRALEIEKQKEEEAQKAKEKKIKQEEPVIQVPDEEKRKRNRIGALVVLLLGGLTIWFLFGRSETEVTGCTIQKSENGYELYFNGEAMKGVFDTAYIKQDTTVAVRNDSIFIVPPQSSEIIYFDESGASKELSKPKSDDTEKAKKDWNTINAMPREKVTIQMLDNFLKNYPGNMWESRILEWKKELIIKLKESLNEEGIYNQAIQTQSITFCDLYLSQYPGGKFRKQIVELKNRLIKAEEENLWSRAKAENTVEAYERYLGKYPSGIYVSEAREAIKKIEEIRQKERESAVEPTSISNAQNGQEDTPSPVKPKEPEITNENLPPLVSAIDKNMVKVIKGGIHTLGCDDKNRGCEPKDGIKTVAIGSFIMSKHEVTQEQFKAIMGSNPSFFNNNPRNPVENLTYNEVMEFIRRLNNLPGNPYKYRLPTEAEWEYAALAGSNMLYSGSDNAESVAVIENTGTAVVGKKKPNAWGLFDMSGNVAEFCSDNFGPFVDGKSKSKFKVVKGGSYLDGKNMVRVKKRSKAETDRPYTFIGFRLVRDTK